RRSVATSDPFASASGRRYRMTLNAYGVYNIQVVSKDATRSSEIHTLRFYPRLTPEVATAASIETIFPKHNASVVGRKSRATHIVPLSWSDPTCARRRVDCRYRWTVYREDGSV